MKRMRSTLSVLHVSYFDNVGGSAQAAYRLHTGLKRRGIRSRMLVSRKTVEDEDVDCISRGTLWKVDQVCDRVGERLSLKYLFYPSSFLLPRRRWFQEADVLQFCNTHSGYFSHTALAHISSRRPVVWRLDDMWPMTGHCTFSHQCERWKTGCGSCPRLSDYPYLRRDTTALHWRIKKWVYAHSNFTMVAPSRWMAKLAQQSPLLGNSPIHVIPYGLDTEIFKPRPKAMARHMLGIEHLSRVVLFIGHSVLQLRKGGHLAREALEGLGSGEGHDITLLIVGEGADQWEAPSHFQTKRLGFVRDASVMAAAYSASDILICPSLADNLPWTALEALACGTPVVAFDVGGLPEIVRHMETGYLARPQDVADLAAGIRILLEDESLRTRLSQTARQVAEREYSLELQAERYLSLYQTILEGKGRAG